MYKKFAFIGFFMAVFTMGCDSGGKKMVFQKYPDMKLGFTTQNFINTTPVSVGSAKRFISYAKKQGYSWIELRDPAASLTLEQSREIASFARDNNIEIIYSIQRGLLDSDFWDIFKRGVINAPVFDGPGMYRALTTGKEFQSDPSKLGWTKEEFEQAVKTANEAAAVARGHGIRFAVENSNGDIDGYNKPYYGLSEFFDQTNPDVAWQFDVANFFWVPKANITARQVEEFTRKYASRMAYIHLKSARDRKALSVLDGNPLDFETIFSIMNENNVHYIAIELDAIKDEQQIYKNHAISIDYLVRNGFITIK